MNQPPTREAAADAVLPAREPDHAEHHPATLSVLAALRERIERLEADVRRLQSQLANRA